MVVVYESFIKLFGTINKPWLQEHHQQGQKHGQHLQ